MKQNPNNNIDKDNNRTNRIKKNINSKIEISNESNILENIIATSITKKPINSRSTAKKKLILPSDNVNNNNKLPVDDNIGNKKLPEKSVKENIVKKPLNARNAKVEKPAKEVKTKPLSVAKAKEKVEKVETLPVAKEIAQDPKSTKPPFKKKPFPAKQGKQFQENRRNEIENKVEGKLEQEPKAKVEIKAQTENTEDTSTASVQPLGANTERNRNRRMKKKLKQQELKLQANLPQGNVAPSETVETANKSLQNNELVASAQMPLQNQKPFNKKNDKPAFNKNKNIQSIESEQEAIVPEPQAEAQENERPQLENRNKPNNKFNKNNPKHKGEFQPKDDAAKPEQNTEIAQTEPAPNKQAERLTNEERIEKIENKNKQNQVQRENKQKALFQQNKNKLNQEKDLDLKNFPPVNRMVLLRREEMQELKYKNYFETITNTLIHSLHVEKEARVLVGVSGGVDSIVLLDLLANVAQNYRIKIAIAHFDHELRGSNSEQDAKFVKTLAERYGFRCFWTSGNVKSYADKNQLSIEQSARLLRYKFFEKVLTNEKFDFLALAHNADDSVETFFINLFRGTGLTGLSGIPAKRNITKNAYLIRPIQLMTKKQIKEYAENRNLSWREDESNAESIYTRNKVRNELIPFIEKEFNPAAIQAITRATRLIHNADKFIGDRVKDYIDKVAEYNTTTGVMKLHIGSLQSYNSFIQGEIFLMSLQKHLKMQSMSMNYIDQVLNLPSKEIGTTITIADGMKVLRDRDYLILKKAKLSETVNKRIIREGEHKFSNFVLKFSIVDTEEIRLGENKNVEYFDSEFMPILLNIRKWTNGDTFQPLGMQGNVKLSDYFINNKINQFDKDKSLVLTDGVDIMWVVGNRIAEKYKITDDSTEILKVEFIELANQNND